VVVVEVRETHKTQHIEEGMADQVLLLFADLMLELQLVEL